jgi:DNA mismatch repair ATPase MutS
MLFSTHFNGIQQKCKDSEKVEVCRMGYAFNEEMDQLTYLYKLEKGPCPTSFGIQVAHIAGLPSQVVNNAYSKSLSFTK